MSPQPTLSISMSARPLVAVVVPAFLLALWIPIVVDGRAARRRLRRQALRAAVPVSGGHQLPVRPAPAGQVPGAGYRPGPGNGSDAVNGNGSSGHGRSPQRRAGAAR
jgi:hypothetical protein